MSDHLKTAAESPRLHGLAFGNYETARNLLGHLEQHMGHPVSSFPVMTGSETHEEMLSATTSLLHNVLRFVEEHLPVTRGEARREEVVAVDHAVVESMNEQQLAEHVDPHVQLEHQEEAETAALNERELGEHFASR